jgi:hypothetical protein
MTERINRKVFMFYPEDRMKGTWDLFITLVLLITCLYTPIEIAFDEGQGGSTPLFSVLIDICFILDIIVIFNSAYYTVDMDIIDDRKNICCSYLSGWFLIDLMSVIPFEIILNATSFN